MAKRPAYNPYEEEVMEMDEPPKPDTTPQDSLERVLEPYDDKTKIKLLRSYASYLSNKVKALQAIQTANWNASTPPTMELA